MSAGFVWWWRRQRSAPPDATAAAALSLARRGWIALTSEMGLSSDASASAAVASAIEQQQQQQQHNLRNIGISAHIDSGKTTLTERILFYTGRIKNMHEVRGKDGVGATMDSMDLEREKGITIQSAATYCSWGDHNINIIDTPGHVDFTVEVERALRVLDGAVLVLCSVGGVQSQSITVDRQMRRYNVPRLAFINKCDRAGASPQKVLEQVRRKLRHRCAMIQVPLGLERDHQGAIDVIEREAVYFEGERGETPVRKPVPSNMVDEMESCRQELVETLAEVDEKIEEFFLMGEEVPAAELKAAIRRATIGLKFFPVMVGSAYKNKGVQLLLDAVVDYLPSPMQVENTALDQSNHETRIQIESDPQQPLIALAFKLEEGRYGQLTYLRVYRGTLRKGDTIVNVATSKKVKVSRLVRIHSDDMEDINEAAAGQIVALFGVECSSGDTFTSGDRITMESMHTPAPVMSLAVAPKDRSSQGNFTKALQRFQREDPTFQVGFDSESNETIISGMGELHLEIYLERMKREYNVETISGKPQVNFRETIQRRASFDYLHKKQSGGSGQYGRVAGYIEPMSPEEVQSSGDGESEKNDSLEFVNEIVGTAIPSQFIPAIEKGFREAANSGLLIGHPIERMRVVLQDGSAHQVDSSELAFKLAATYALRQCYMEANPTILEPVMDVEITVPVEFQGSVVANLNKRKGLIQNSTSNETDAIIKANVPLNQMFGYATELRSLTQGKGEFAMEYSYHAEVPREAQKEIQSAKKMQAA